MRFFSLSLLAALSLILPFALSTHKDTGLNVITTPPNKQDLQGDVYLCYEPNFISCFKVQYNITIPDPPLSPCEVLPEAVWEHLGSIEPDAGVICRLPGTSDLFAEWQGMIDRGKEARYIGCLECKDWVTTAKEETTTVTRSTKRGQSTKKVLARKKSKTSPKKKTPLKKKVPPKKRALAQAQVAGLATKRPAYIIRETPTLTTVTDDAVGDAVKVNATFFGEMPSGSNCESYLGLESSSIVPNEMSSAVSQPGRDNNDNYNKIITRLEELRTKEVKYDEEI
ncbi:hypothetical protein V8F33_005665 [Rhypophila sp. PSN 637]